MKDVTKPTKPRSSAASAAKAAPATTTRRKKAPSPAQIDSELRYRMISEAAYLIAESHGFDSNRSLDDWLEAEAQIDQMLSGHAAH